MRLSKVRMSKRILRGKIRMNKNTKIDEAFRSVVADMKFSPNEFQCFCKDTNLEEFEKRGYLTGYDKVSKTYRIVFLQKHSKCNKIRISIADKKSNGDNHA